MKTYDIFILPLHHFWKLKALVPMQKENDQCSKSLFLNGKGELTQWTIALNTKQITNKMNPFKFTKTQEMQLVEILVQMKIINMHLILVWLNISPENMQ